MSKEWDDVSELWPSAGLLFIPQMIYECRAMVGGMILTGGETEELGEKPIPLSLRPPQIPHELTQVWIWASVVRGQWLTTWAMAQHSCHLFGCAYLFMCKLLTVWDLRFSRWWGCWWSGLCCWHFRPEVEDGVSLKHLYVPRSLHGIRTQKNIIF
jgi:hypothetical protein